MGSLDVMSPVIQYGFAAFCVVLLAALALLGRAYVKATQRFEDILVTVVSENTVANNKLVSVLEGYEKERKNDDQNVSRTLSAIQRKVEDVEKLLLRRGA